MPSGQCCPPLLGIRWLSPCCLALLAAGDSASPPVMGTTRPINLAAINRIGGSVSNATDQLGSASLVWSTCGTPLEAESTGAAPVQTGHARGRAENGKSGTTCDGRVPKTARHCCRGRFIAPTAWTPGKCSFLSTTVHCSRSRFSAPNTCKSHRLTTRGILADRRRYPTSPPVAFLFSCSRGN